MPLAILSPPLLRPVTLDQIRQHLRLDSAQEDDLLNTYCDAAVDYIEGYISKFLISRSVRQFVDALPRSREISLEAEPVSEVSEIRGFDVDGNANVIAPFAYVFHPQNQPSVIEFGTNLPEHVCHNGLEIDFVTGLGESGAELPQNIIRALLVLIAHWYDYRGTSASGDVTGSIPDGVQKLLAPHRNVNL